MDVATMVLQNVDELMWSPSPACAQSPASTSFTSKRRSCSVLVIEPRVQSSIIFLSQLRQRRLGYVTGGFSIQQTHHVLPLAYAAASKWDVVLPVRAIARSCCRATVDLVRMTAAQGVKILHFDMSQFRSYYVDLRRATRHFRTVLHKQMYARLEGNLCHFKWLWITPLSNFHNFAKKYVRLYTDVSFHNWKVIIFNITWTSVHESMEAHPLWRVQSSLARYRSATDQRQIWKHDSAHIYSFETSTVNKAH